jgi:hypothetical protein
MAGKWLVGQICGPIFDQGQGGIEDRLSVPGFHPGLVWDCERVRWMSGSIPGSLQGQM